MSCHRQRRPPAPPGLNPLSQFRLSGSDRHGHRPAARARCAQHRSRCRRQSQLAFGDAADHRQHFRTAFARSGSAADLHGHRRLHRQSQEPLQRGKARLADAFVVCHHRADCRGHRHRARPRHPAGRQYGHCQHGSGGTVLHRLLARLPEGPRPGQRLRPRSLDQNQQRRRQHLAELQRAAASWCRSPSALPR